MLEEMMSNAYIYVLPSDIEGMPISLLEAMSYGTCCLASDIAENKAVISSYGYTFRRGDVNNLEKIMKKLINNEEMVYNKRDETIEHIKRNFNWDVSTRLTYELYKTVLGKGR